MVERTRTDLIVIHCSATRAAQDIGVSEIDQWHRLRGWGGCGYHFVIRRNGEVEVGRKLGTVGAHVKGYNKTSVGICLVGGVDIHGEPEKNFTAEQFGRLRTLLASLRALYPKAEILGHRDLSPDVDGDGVIEAHEFLKSCPCFDVREWLNAEQIA